MGVNSFEDGTAGPVSEEAQRIHNRGAVGFFLLFIGIYLLGFGGTMTGLAYGYELKDGYTSLAESYNLRTDIAGPVLISVGGTSALVSVILLIMVKRANSKAAWEQSRSGNKTKETSSTDEQQGIFTISGNSTKD